MKTIIKRVKSGVKITAMKLFKIPKLSTKRLSSKYPKSLAYKMRDLFLKVCKHIPGADILFLAIFLKEIKMYVLSPFRLEEWCGGEIVSWVYDLYVTYLIVTGFVIYIVRRYYLSRKRS